MFEPLIARSQLTRRRVGAAGHAPMRRRARYVVYGKCDQWGGRYMMGGVAN